MPKPLAWNTWSGRPLRLLTALSALTFLISCGADTEARLAEAARQIGETRAAEAAAPRLPQDCREHTIIRPALGERLDELVLRYDWALRDEHARTDRCARWHDTTFNSEGT